MSSIETTPHDVDLASGETTFHYDSGPRVENGRLATWLFLAAETLFFGGLLSAWFVLRQGTPNWSAGEGPSLVVALIMTALLVSASWFGHTAVAAARESKHMGLAGRLGFSALLAFGFLCLQAVEYGQLVQHDLVPATSVRWAMFYAITLCHGLHVAIGVVWLVYLIFRAAGSGLGGAQRAPLEYGVLYLHFVDVVWLVIVVLLYLVR